MTFADRFEAGRLLAAHLTEFAGRSDTVVVALARGGVPVGYEIARVLDLPLDVLVVRKLGVPEQPELALGAIASGGLLVLNHDVVNAFALSSQAISAIATREQNELERRETQYRDARPQLALEGRTVLLVDDGLATGSSVRVALQALRVRGVAGVVLALPVAPLATLEALEWDADGIVCLKRPADFQAVGAWYRKFDQTPDTEVRDLLRRARRDSPAGSC